MFVRCPTDGGRSVACHNDDIANDERNARPGVTSRGQPEPVREIDPAVVAEVFAWFACLRVKREQITSADAERPRIGPLAPITQAPDLLSIRIASHARL